jgi:hypothetical protein
MTLSGAEQAIVTDLNEAWREHVLEEAADEFCGGDGAELELVSGRFFVRESDSAIMELAQAVVGDSDAKDVRGDTGRLAGRSRRVGNEPPIVSATHGCRLEQRVAFA